MTLVKGKSMVENQRYRVQKRAHDLKNQGADQRNKFKEKLMT
jgi:hypothetical protein